MLAEEADGVAHVLGARGAVQADDVDLEGLERGEHGGDVRAQEHLAAVGQQGDGDLDRQRPPDVREGLAGAEDGGLDLEDVLRRLDHDQVGAALGETARLLLEDSDEVAEADAAERGVVGRGQEAGRADRAGDEAVLADGGAGDLRRAAVDLERVLVEPPLLELEARRLEGVGLHDLRARLDHRLVHALDDVGAVEHQRLVTAAGEPVVLLEGEVELLEGGTHAAVEDDDAGVDRLTVVAHVSGILADFGPTLTHLWQGWLTSSL
ncbi:MAG: hypothetical protein AVDCRST_MAG64-2611 [uncultured Phycisphaerae bacterium]|uniref:Uncharacterized protein n=1 Tax=uncultured Phycisphaerae bacterium TaxID=904963 RepID=A0A6J4PII0_9BACT|nr:MAG: hypothetical protein AVDCRST_MAG64-2611 [uncultured Phycisphaerae bacterium]